MTQSKKPAAQRKPAESARSVPLVVPCTGADAGSDFETSLEVVRRDGKVHKLWQGEPVKQDIRRVS